MFSGVADSAKKALSLKNDIIFKLLIVMTALLGWLAGVGAGGMLSLENMYEEWHLEQKSRVSVYLLASSKEKQIIAMQNEMISFTGIKGIERLSNQQIKEVLSQYIHGDEYFPMPVVMDFTVDDSLDREIFASKIKNFFPNAEVDDARIALETVGKGVRFAQATAVILASIALLVVGLLVSFTVRAGLRGKVKTLSVLQHVGATDKFVTRLVTSQVLRQSILGWFIAVILSASSIWIAVDTLEGTGKYLSWEVWAGIIIIPFLLVVISVLSSWLTTYNVVRGIIKIGE